MPLTHPCATIPLLARSSPRKTPAASAVEVTTALQMLHKISHVELVDYQKVDGVKYYVLNVYEKESRRRTAGSASSISGIRQLSQFKSRPLSSTAPAQGTSNVSTSRKPACRVVKRFRDFEELRKQLQRCFGASGTSNGDCACCDGFTTFLACYSMQPNLLVKWIKREADRKLLLEQYINQLIRLAVMETGGASHHPANVTCSVKHEIPWILQQFICASSQQKANKIMENDEMPTSAC